MRLFYSKIILDHYQRPRNFGKLKKPDLVTKELNPLCGDEITIYIEIKKTKIKNLKFEARGCALSLASASVLSEIVQNKSVGSIQKIARSDIEKRLKVKVNKARESCMTLALNAVKNTVLNLIKNQTSKRKITMQKKN